MKNSQEKTIKVYDGQLEHTAHVRKLTAEASKMNKIKDELEEAFADTGIIIDVNTFVQGWANVQSQLDAYIKAQPKPLQESVKGYLYAQLNKMQGKYQSINLGTLNDAPSGLMFIAEQIDLIDGMFVAKEPSKEVFDILLPESKYKALEAYINAFNGLYDVFGKAGAMAIADRGIYDTDERASLGYVVHEKMDVKGIGSLAKHL